MPQARESENDNPGKMAPTVTLTVAPIKRQMQINLMTDIGPLSHTINQYLVAASHTP